MEEPRNGDKACVAGSELVLDSVRSGGSCCVGYFGKKAIFAHCREHVFYFILKENQWHWLSPVRYHSTDGQSVQMLFKK